MNQNKTQRFAGRMTKVAERTISEHAKRMGISLSAFMVYAAENFTAKCNFCDEHKEEIGTVETPAGYELICVDCEERKHGEAMEALNG